MSCGLTLAQSLAEVSGLKQINQQKTNKEADLVCPAVQWTVFYKSRTVYILVPELQDCKTNLKI